MAEINKIIAGEYDGCKLVQINDRVYVERSSGGINLSSATVASTLIAGTAGSSAREQYVKLFGVTGAVLSNGMKDHMIEITWKNGGKSLACCDDVIAPLVLGAPYKSSQSEAVTKQAFEDKSNSENLGWLIFFFVALIYCVYFTVSSW